MKTDFKMIKKAIASGNLSLVSFLGNALEAELLEIIKAYDALEPEKDGVYRFIKEILGEQ